MQSNLLNLAISSFAHMISMNDPAILLQGTIRCWPLLRLNSSSPTSELNRISPYIIGTISSRQVNENKEKYELWEYCLVQF